MSSYLEKYHLQKVEPVRVRNKDLHYNFYRMKPKTEKTGSVKIEFKPKVAHHRNYPHPEEAKPNLQIPKT